MLPMASAAYQKAYLYSATCPGLAQSHSRGPNVSLRNIAVNFPTMANAWGLKSTMPGA